MKVLVTGANGFVGENLCKVLRVNGYEVIAQMRNSSSAGEGVVINPMDANVNWIPVLSRINVVIHLAARVHVMGEDFVDSLNKHLAVNTYATLNLASQAATAGVKRFIFISSAGVSGASSLSPFTPSNAPNPHNDYSLSKLKAEQGLIHIAEKTGMELVVVRPPLVYGSNVKANFAKLLNALHLGIPLPFGSVINNRRSFVGIDNLVDFLLICTQHPAAANQIFMVSDGEDLSTEGLLRRLGAAIGHPVRLIKVPVKVLALVFKLTGKMELSRRLLENFQVDISKNEQLLGWKPKISVNEGFRRIVGNTK
jgi:nucleoside-diphosphate-sugar epimerase